MSTNQFDLSLNAAFAWQRPLRFNFAWLLIAAALCVLPSSLAESQQSAARSDDSSINLSPIASVKTDSSLNSALVVAPGSAAAPDFSAVSSALREAPLAPEFDEQLAAQSSLTKLENKKAPVASNLVIEGLVSYGHYKIFASGSSCKLYTAGVEYDRNSFGRLLGARFDWVLEFLPLILLDAPQTQDIYGTATSPNKKIVPGIGIAPIGFRLLWRDKKAIKPYFLVKGGMIGFTQKALSQEATYENFSLQQAMGVNVKMNERWDVRLGLFSDFHFSNAFIVPVNPGLDVMNANLGLSYNFGK